ncbi:MAG: sigma-54 dependent transcriptional regulator, partial [Candidatus Binataceae bacterium]
GESGTGKELLARALHFESQRRDGPLVPVNCAALPEHLIESELFGHVKGAFTDAHQNKTGLFVAASGGTLFLDEIGELPLPLQPKLLRVIEDKKVRPVGARVEVPVDVRLVSATNAELEKAIAAGTFRSDLYYRLATVSLTVPPLRARPDDIPLLVRHFLVRTSAGVGKPVPELAPEAMSRMTTYQWPGNVRELHAAIQRGVILCRNNRLTLDDLPPTMLGADAQLVKILDAAVERRLTLDQLDREYVRAMLESVGGNKTQAASILQIDRKTLYRKLEEPEPAEPDSPD